MAWGWLKKLVGVGAPLAIIAVNSFAPGLGPVITAIISAATLAEDKLGGGKGTDKFALVLDYLRVAAPGLIKSIEQATGKELVDEQLFEDGLKDTAEGVVKLLNAFRLLPKGAT
jgi:hypothetical protein